jgi:hypothetical protein
VPSLKVLSRDEPDVALESRDYDGQLCTVHVAMVRPTVMSMSIPLTTDGGFTGFLLHDPCLSMHTERIILSSYRPIC